jgi:hypothetical protein
MVLLPSLGGLAIGEFSPSTMPRTGSHDDLPRIVRVTDDPKAVEKGRLGRRAIVFQVILRRFSLVVARVNRWVFLIMEFVWCGAAMRRLTHWTHTEFRQEAHAAVNVR